jgi:hypothetical protein
MTSSVRGRAQSNTMVVLLTYPQPCTAPARPGARAVSHGVSESRTVRLCTTFRDPSAANSLYTVLVCLFNILVHSIGLPLQNTWLLVETFSWK